MEDIVTEGLHRAARKAQVLTMLAGVLDYGKTKVAI
jgi:hypothetical protein